MRASLYRHVERLDRIEMKSLSNLMKENFELDFYNFLFYFIRLDISS